MAIFMTSEEFERLYQGLGPTLKRLRSEKGMTQVELAKLNNKSQSMIARMESTNAYDVTLRTLHEFVEPLGISLSELFAEVEGKSISKISKVHSSHAKKWESISNRIQSMNDDTRLWTLKLIENILDRPEE